MRFGSDPEANRGIAAGISRVLFYLSLIGQFLYQPFVSQTFSRPPALFLYMYNIYRFSLGRGGNCFSVYYIYM